MKGDSLTSSNGLLAFLTNSGTHLLWGPTVWYLHILRLSPLFQVALDRISGFLAWLLPETWPLSPHNASFFRAQFPTPEADLSGWNGRSMTACFYIWSWTFLNLKHGQTDILGYREIHNLWTLHLLQREDWRLARWKRRSRGVLLSHRVSRCPSVLRATSGFQK